MSSMGGMAAKRQIDLPEENHKRLNNASSQLIAFDGKINELAAELRSQISELSSNQVMAMPDLSDIADELGELDGRYNSSITSLFELRTRLVDEKLAVAAANDAIDLIKGNALLIISLEKDEKGKAVYSNDSMRNAAVKRDLADSKQFIAATNALKELESAVGKTLAEIDLHEDLLKEYGRRNAAMISRLDHSTVKIKALGGA